MKTSPTKNQLLRRIAEGVVLGLLLVAIYLSAYSLSTLEHNNFHVVVPGKVYRSSQMNGEELARCIKNYGIKSVLNLRGANSTKSWYQAEITAASQCNVAHCDWRLGACDELSVEKMDELIGLLRSLPKPVLIHCQGGADRTGLASALYCFAVEHQKPEIADGQLTVWDGHMPFYWLKEQAMDHSFWRYVTDTASSSNSISKL